MDAQVSMKMNISYEKKDYNTFSKADKYHKCHKIH